MRIVFHRAALAAIPLAAGLLVPAFVVAAQAFQSAPVPLPAKTKNPVPNTHENLIAGASEYREQCAGCHGPAGVPVRKFPRLRNQPANLTKGDGQGRTDAQLFNVMTHGTRGGMPAFADDMTETQRWQVALFIHRLNKDAASLTAELPPETH